MASSPFAPGARIGPYEISETVGAGGMGIVFRARDTLLHRTVAIKVLSAERLNQPGDRLLAEARAASALNHPGICTVHEVREEGGQVVLVMEYVDGRPLSELIPHGGLPAETVARYGLQIVDALAHAHDRGVMHRDLKSANVIVSKEGRLKIVDFGLARPLPSRGPDDLTGSDQSLGDSAEIGGTLAYMAPEVLNGQLATAAGDVWAVGVLLYEMGAGDLPFGGRTPFEISAAILRAPVPPLPPHVPASLRTIIARCLTKEPEQRYQTAREVRAAIETAQSDAAMQPIARPARPDRTLSVVAWALAAGLLVALVALLLPERSTGPPAPQPASGALRQIFASEREVFDPALSGDGSMIAFVAEDERGQADLFVARVAGGGRVRVTSDPALETRPRFSPDGERIAFGRRQADAQQPEIAVVPSLGGDASVVIRGGSHPAWSPDGGRLAFIRVGPGSALALAISRLDGSEPIELARSDGPYPFLQTPAWSPDGRTVVFIRGAGGIAGEIWAIPAGGGELRRISSDPPSAFSHDPTFSADGRSIVHSSNRGGATNIWASPLDGGAPARLTTGTGPDTSPSTDRTGRTAFANTRSVNQLLIHHLETGTARELLRHAEFLWAPAFSPDGRTLAYSRSEVDGSWHIWLADLDGAAPRRLTSADTGAIYPRWTPDGRSVLYHTWSTPRRIWSVPRQGGPPAPLTDAALDAAFGDLSPDGRELAFVVAEGDAERVYVQSLADGTTRRLREAAASLPRWSPDGRWLAFASDRSYLGGIYRARPDGGGERRLTSSGGWPVWWRDGRRIGYLTVTPDTIQQIRTVGLDGSAAGTLLPIEFGGWNHPFDVAPGDRLLAAGNYVHVSSEIWVLEPNR